MINGIEIYTPATMGAVVASPTTSPAVALSTNSQSPMRLVVSSPSGAATGLPDMQESNSPAIDAFFTEWGRPGTNSLLSRLTLSEMGSSPDTLSPPSDPAQKATSLEDPLEIETSLFVPISTTF